MSKGTKIVLISLSLLAVGVGVYLLVSNNKNKSGNPEKDNRKILIKRSK
jgi:hypothetical protein